MASPASHFNTALPFINAHNVDALGPPIETSIRCNQRALIIGRSVAYNGSGNFRIGSLSALQSSRIVKRASFEPLRPR